MRTIERHSAYFDVHKWHDSSALILVVLLLLAPVRLHAADYVLHTFKKMQLSDKFWSEAAAFGDINRDGHDDVVAGPFWYAGPDFNKRHAFFPATRTFSVRKPDGSQVSVEGWEGALGSGVNAGEGEYIFAEVVDLNGDGWPDILTVGWRLPAGIHDLARGQRSKLLNKVDPARFPSRVLAWYENPGPLLRQADAPWIEHIVAAGVDGQSIQFVDLLKSGHRVLLCMHHAHVGYFSPDLMHPERKWTFHSISGVSSEFQWYSHGLGYGDLNNDGRNDVLYADGWWEQPASLEGDPQWRFRPYPFALGPGQTKLFGWNTHEKPIPVVADVASDGVTLMGPIYGTSQMYVDDLNGDGLPDVVTSLAAHGYGLAWWEQLASRGRAWWESPGEQLGEETQSQFRRHIILNKEPKESRYGIEFSEMQALAWADMDGDGLKDIVTGKRFWAHGRCCIDPESDAPAVLYWFKQVRDPDHGVRFIPYLIDDNSGAGTQVTVGDVDGDGHPDIIVANKKGAFVFLQELKTVGKDEWERAQPPILFPDGK